MRTFINLLPFRPEFPKLLPWGSGVALGLVVLAIAQIGVHLVFFLHITTAPDNTNNVLALVFGVFIVFLVIVLVPLDRDQSKRQCEAVALSSPIHYMQR